MARPNLSTWIMGTLEEMLDTTLQGSAVDRAFKLALIAALSYHVACQYRRQKDVLICMCAFAALNVFHFTSIMTQPLSEIYLGIFVFNTVFVLPIELLC